MASMVQLAQTIQLDDYASLVVITAVVYDYILTFPKEVEYIWTKPWTRVSTLFILARYFGLCCVITFTTVGTSLIPGPAKVSDILIYLGIWALWIFIAAADLVMILRVWALYSRSKFILGALIVLYAVDFILYLVDCFLLSTHDKVIVATAQVFNFSLCVLQPGSPALTEAIDGLQMALGALMCLLVVIRFIRESLQMYKLTKSFQPSRYMNLFVREGVFYFLAILTYTLLNTLVVAAHIPMSGWWLLLIIVQFIPTFTLVPRFILSLRQLYAHDLNGGRGSEIDTAFGLAPVSECREDAAANTIQFADAEQNDWLEQDEDILMEGRQNRSAGSGV